MKKMTMMKKTYIAAAAFGLILAAGQLSWASSEAGNNDKWQDSVHTWGSWNKNSPSAGPTQTFSILEFKAPEFLPDRPIKKEEPKEKEPVCPPTLYGYSTYDVLFGAGNVETRTDGEGGGYYSSEPSNIALKARAHVDHNNTGYTFYADSANGVSSEEVVTRTGSAEHPALDSGYIPSTFMNGGQKIHALGGWTDGQVTINAYQKLGGNTPVYIGDWSVNAGEGDQSAIGKAMVNGGSRTGFGYFVAGIPTSTEHLDSLKLNGLLANYSGAAYNVIAASGNPISVPLTATIDFGTGNIEASFNNGVDGQVAFFTDARGMQYVGGEVGYLGAGKLTGQNFELNHFYAADGQVSGTVVGTIYGSEAQIIGGVSDVSKTYGVDEASVTARHVNVFVADKEVNNIRK